MSIASVLSNAYSGINANQAALRVTANNVANANTEGYARQDVALISEINGGIGAGVTVKDIQRVVDNFLEADEREAISGAEQASIVRAFHDQIQGFLGRPDSDSSLNARLDVALQAFNTVALDPSDDLRRQGLIADLEAFTQEVAALATNVQGLRIQASNKISEQVDLANAALEQIERLNPLVARAALGGAETGALEDQRNQAIRDLAEILDIQVAQAPGGAVRISTADGVTLLDSSRRELSYTAPGAGDPTMEFGRIETTRLNALTGNPEGTSKTLDPSITGGRIKGLIDMRDKDLPEIAETLGEFARVVTDQYNAVHNVNAGLPAPTTMTGRDTFLQGSDLAHMTGIADFAVVDGAGLVVAKTTIDFTALGAAATMTDVINAINAGLGGTATASLSSQGALTLTAANAANGVVIAPDETDPAQRAGRGFSHFFGMNDLLTSSVPSHYETGFLATDAHGFALGDTIEIEIRDAASRTLRNETITISGSTFGDILNDLNDPAGLGGYMTFALSATGELTTTPQPGFGQLELIPRFDTTQRGASGATFSDIFGWKRGATATFAKDLKVADPVAQNSSRLSLGVFDRSVAVGERALTVGDGRGAAVLRDLESQAFAFRDAGSIEPKDTTVSQYAAYVLGNIAVLGETASSKEADTRAQQITISQKRQDVSGVNIDEELAEMVVFQNAYNASARLISTASQMFDELLRVI